MRRFVAILVGMKLWLLLVVVTLVAQSQPKPAKQHVEPTPTPVVSDAITRNTSTPYDGDLSIFEDADREKNLQIGRVMDILKISGERAVADIGAGSGWFTVRAAKRTTGKVFAVEINQEYIDHIKTRAATEKLPNITTVLGTFDDPKLARDSVDAVLILKTYHEIEKPITFMKNLKAALRKGSLVGIIDKNGTGDDHGLDRDKVVEELKRAGFALKEEHDFVKPDRMDYFLVFEVEK